MVDDIVRESVLNVELAEAVSGIYRLCQSMTGPGEQQ
jgi:hypothetical protein